VGVTLPGSAEELIFKAKKAISKGGELLKGGLLGEIPEKKGGGKLEL